MADLTRIEWCDRTWNPVTGCTKVSPGCKHCYAEVMARRLKAMGQAKYRNGFEVTLHPDTLEQPLRWRKPANIFVNSMSDLFHEAVPLEFIQAVFDVMRRAPWHRFQVLTKRAERLVEVACDLPWPPNVWMGVSIESEAQLWRADALCCVPAWTRFLSLEPLLGPIDLTPVFEGWREVRCPECGTRPPDFVKADDWPAFWPAEWHCCSCSANSLPMYPQPRIHWVIAGGESGPGARPCDPAWIRHIRYHCLMHDVPFFLKQLGGYRDKRGGDKALLDNQMHREWPRWVEWPEGRDDD